MCSLCNFLKVGGLNENMVIVYTTKVYFPKKLYIYIYIYIYIYNFLKKNKK
jgi:hypothetical protein